MKTWSVSLAMSASLLILLSGCASAAQNASAAPTSGNAAIKVTDNFEKMSVASVKPVEGGSIEIDSAENFRDLDPAIAYDAASDEPVLQMYDQLVTYAGSTTNTKAMLAKSWNVTNGGKTYTFHLRSGVKFWNGDPVTAQSFVDEFQRVLTPSLASPGQSFIDPLIVGADAFFKGHAKTITGIKATNQYTLVIQLSQPFTSFLKIMSMPFFSAVDMKYIKQVGDKAFDSGKAMGSGPFELQTYDSTEMVLTKNPHYWMRDSAGNALPYLDKITINETQDTTLDALRFEQGQTAFLGTLIGIPSSSYTQMANNPNYRKDIIKATQNQVYYIGLNNKLKPFNNPLVRQAINDAIDKNGILKLENGRGIIANQPIPVGLPGHVNKLPQNAAFSYNVKKAKALLAQAGVKPGTTIDLYSQNDPDVQRIDTAIQSDLKQVGLKVNIQAISFATYLDKIVKGQAPMFYLAWSPDYPDPADFLQPFVSTNPSSVNTVFYSNKSVDHLLNQATSEQNQAKRQSLLTQATDTIVQGGAWVPLYYPINYYAAQSWVHGFYVSPILPDPLRYIWVDQSKA